MWLGCSWLEDEPYLNESPEFSEEETFEEISRVCRPVFVVILIGICLGLIFVSFNPSSILLRWLCPPSAGQPTRTALLNRNELQLSDHCFPPDNVDDDHGDDDKEEEEEVWYLKTRVVVCAG